MTPQELKNSILQLAIQGKLVEQRTEEGTAENLYKQIQAENQKLIKDGKIKKQNALPEITEDEIPFDIPNNWKWARLGSVVSFINGRAYKREELHDSGKYKVLRVGNFFTNDSWYYSDMELEDEKYCNYGDLLYAWSASFGPKIWDGDKTIFHYHIWNVKYDNKQFFREYLFWFFEADKRSIRNYTTGSTMVHVSMTNMIPRLIPIPPLEEQKRIVAKIEELLPLIDKYEKAWTKLEEFNKKFPADMQKSILQMAIQGKLVEQHAEEGTAEELYRQIQEEKQRLIKEGKIKKQKALPEITEDEIPFDIPDSWKWVRLGDCGSFVRGSGIKKGEVTPEGMPCVRYGQLYTTYKTRFSQSVSFIPEALFEKCKKARPNDILMALTGENKVDIALAVAYEGNTDLAMGGDMTKFTSLHMSPLYLVYLINSPYGIGCKSKLATGDIIVHISNDKLASIPIPLPPLEEQKRIVAKIEELLPMCDKLK